MKVLCATLIVFFITLSCGDNRNMNDNISLQDSIVKPPISNTSQRIQVTLQKEPQAIVNTWLAYITAQDEMTELSDAPLDIIVDKSSNYAKIMNELRETVPSQLQSTAVKSRLTVLLTKSRILEQLTKRQTLDKVEIMRLAEELPQDFENFKLQLNEIFLKTPDQFEIELDDQLDSIQKANEEQNDALLQQNN